MNMIAYLRVSTQEQADSGAGLDAQRSAIAAAIEARGWTLDDVAIDAGVSGSTPWQERPELARAIAALESGAADGLIVAKLDRLSRSTFDFAYLMHMAREQDWHIVCLDLGVDTSTPTGRFIAHILASVAELELDMIRQRTREGLAAKRAAGVRLGRRPSIPDDVRARIIREHREGKNGNAIATDLNRDGVPTALGGRRWYASTIAGVIDQEARLQPVT